MFLRASDLAWAKEAESCMIQLQSMSRETLGSNRQMHLDMQEYRALKRVGSPI